MFEDFDDYDGYRAREAMRVCPQCGRPELFCDDDHESDVALAARLAR